MNNRDQKTTFKLKLLVVDHSGEPGGGQLGLLRYLQQVSTFERSLLLLEGGSLVDKFRGTGVPVRVLPGSGGKLSVLGKVATVRRIIRDSEPDIILANSLRAGILVSLLLGVRATRVYYLREGLSQKEISGLKRALVLGALIQRFQGFLANSRWTAATLTPRLHSHRPVEIAYPISGVEPVNRAESQSAGDLSGRADQPLGILFLGRLAPWKGVHVLIAAADELARRGLAEKFAVTIVGGPVFADPGYEARLRQEASNSAASITFTGHLDDISEQLKKNDVLAHCSLDPEPFGQVIVQGMNAGLLVVATRDGGPGEIIVDGVTGILVEANDPIALADVLQNSINNRQYVATISVKAEIAAEEYSDAKMARLYESGLVRIHSEARR